MARLLTDAVAHKMLSIFLVLVILGAVVALVYIIAFPSSGETFTEFYLLDSGGKANEYPTKLNVGQPGTVIIGIVNREQESVLYRVEVRLDGIQKDEVGPIVLENGQRFEQSFSFTPEKPGNEQKLEFLLYKDGQNGAYQSLRLLVDVKE